MDLLWNRNDKIKPLGELAFWFFKKCQQRNYIVIFSNEIEKELLGYVPEKRIKEMTDCFSKIIVKVDSTGKQRGEAHCFWNNTSKRFPFIDILHAIIARDNKAVVVSRDKHFEDIKITECVFPEEAD